MKAIRVIAALSLLALGGCAMTPVQWSNTDPSVSPEQFQRDKAACMVQSDSATANNPNPFSPLYGYQVIFPECMRSKGYIASH